MRDTVTFKDTITVEAFCKLRNSVGFQELTAAQAKTVLSNTSFLVTAVHGDIHIGLVRVLTDMVTDAYITDVIVHPDFQNQGLGQKLVEHAL